MLMPKFMDRVSGQRHLEYGDCDMLMPKFMDRVSEQRHLEYGDCDMLMPKFMDRVSGQRHLQTPVIAPSASFRGHKTYAGRS